MSILIGNCKTIDSLSFAMLAVSPIFIGFKVAMSLPSSESCYINGGIDSPVMVFPLIMMCCLLLLYCSGAAEARAAKMLLAEVSNWSSLGMCYFYEPQYGFVWAVLLPYTSICIQAPLLQRTSQLVCYLKPFTTFTLIDITRSKGPPGYILICVIAGALANSLFLLAACYFNDSASPKPPQPRRFTEAELAAVLEAIPSGLFIFTFTGKFQNCNRACLETLSASCPAEASKALKSLTFTESTDRYFSTDSAGIEPDLQKFISIDEEAQAVLGKSCIGGKTIRWIAKKFFWDNMPALLVVMEDLTTFIELELAKAESSLKSVMLRSVSHELRTPTNGIMHTIHSLVSTEEIPAWAKAKLEMSEVCCKHLLLLINDLLDYSQLVAGKFSLVLSHFPLRPCLQNCIEIVRILAESNHLTLQLHIDPLLPKFVYTDQNRLSQVLINLLSNAIKFTLKGGKVELKAILNDAGMLEASVSDTGIGISPNDISKLFTLFGRLDKSSSINPQGVGLGLHISNKLAQELGYQPITVNSTMQVGSVFTFIANIFEKTRFIPMMGSLEFTESSSESVCTQKVYKFYAFNDHTAQLLVVDDNPFNRLAITDILTEEHIKCDESSSGTEAIEIVLNRAEQGKPFQIVLMDYEMPGLSGPEACRLMLQKLREIDQPLPKVIAYTAYESEEHKKACRDAGMVDILPKPSSRELILSTLMRYFTY